MVNGDHCNVGSLGGQMVDEVAIRDTTLRKEGDKRNDTKYSTALFSVLPFIATGRMETKWQWRLHCKPINNQICHTINRMVEA